MGKIEVHRRSVRPGFRPRSSNAAYTARSICPYLAAIYVLIQELQADFHIGLYLQERLPCGTTPSCCSSHDRTQRSHSSCKQTVQWTALHCPPGYLRNKQRLPPSPVIEGFHGLSPTFEKRFAVCEIEATWSRPAHRIWRPWLGCPSRPPQHGSLRGPSSSPSWPNRVGLHDDGGWFMLQ